MASCTLTIHPDSDSLLSFRGIDQINDSDLSGATVTYELADDIGSVIASGPMLYVELLPTGYYLFRATIPYTTPVTAGMQYNVTVEADAGVGKLRRFLRCVKAVQG